MSLITLLQRGVVLFSILLSAFIINAQNIYYVKQGGLGNGSSWADASGDLQAIINTATDSGQLWVAAGTYKPIRRADTLNKINVNNRNNAFVLKANIKIYGGFAGTETAFNQRNWNAHTTILSGDIGTVDSSKDNCYHVVISSGEVGSAAIDGFTVTGGYANPGSIITVNKNSIDARNGGGIVNYLSSPTISNCNLPSDSAFGNQYYGGGAIYNYSSKAVISNCKFSKNYAYYSGGAIYNSYNGDVTIQNCNFSNNTVTQYGGAIANAGEANPLIRSCSFSANRAGYNGGAIYDETYGSPLIINCVFTGNVAQVAGAYWHNDQGSPYSYSNNAIINCTVYGNSASGSYIGGIYNKTAFFVYNNIIWGNTGGQMYSLGNYDNSIVINNTIEDFLGPETWNNNVYPQFTDTLNVAGNDGILGTTDDGLTLQSTSPAINAGNNIYYEKGRPSITNSLLRDVDVAGNPRIDSSGIVDLGAYETNVGDVYMFTGNGNWTDAANWRGGMIPSTLLPKGSMIIIAGQAVVNEPQIISAGTRLVLWPGSALTSISNLIIQK